MSLNGLRKATILSISYSNVFSYPLNSREVWLRLVTNKPISFTKVKRVLLELVDSNYLHKDQNYYSVVSKELRKLRTKRELHSQNKFLEVKQFVSKARLIPFIRAIVVTGSLSVNNAKQNDDIDWLIITSRKTLWITRPLIILIAMFYGKRRERDGNHRDNSWCFNMFLTDENLSISQEKRSIYTAYEVCQAKFVYDNSNIEQQFLRENMWVKRYLNNFLSFRLSEVNNNNDKRDLKKVVREDSFFVSLLNNLFYYGQYFYMKKRITREVVRKNTAFFHPRDTRGRIFKKWKQILLTKYVTNC